MRAIPAVMVRLGVPVLLLAMPGCIVQDIHDQMALSNEKLEAINTSFAKVEEANALLTRLDGQLASLKSIEENLGSIDERLGGVNVELASMDERLATLQASLSQVDAHLASLRRTINNIDSTIPFLKISGDGEEEAESLEGAARPEPEGEVQPDPAGDGGG